jgi:hypothetical protein
MKEMSIIFALLFAFTVCAQDNQEQDSLDELFEVMDMDSMVNTMYDQMESMFTGIQTDSEMSPEEIAINEEYRKQLTTVMRTQMSWQAMKADLKQIYIQNFTENEIADMLTFYQSPTGQTVLRTMPVVMQESMQIVQAMAQKTIPKLQEISAQKHQALKKLRNSSN